MSWRRCSITSLRFRRRSRPAAALPGVTRQVALAVTTATRSAALPDVPTAGESVPGYEASIWFGMGAPRATPAEIVDRLNKEINAALADLTMKAKLAEQGGELLPGSPADFAKLIAADNEKWGRVIQAANIKPD